MRPKVHLTASRVMTTCGAGELDGEVHPRFSVPRWPGGPGTRNQAHETRHTKLGTRNCSSRPAAAETWLSAEVVGSGTALDFPLKHRGAKLQPKASPWLPAAAPGPSRGRRAGEPRVAHQMAEPLVLSSRAAPQRLRGHRNVGSCVPPAGPAAHRAIPRARQSPGHIEILVFLPCAPGPLPVRTPDASDTPNTSNTCAPQL